VQPEVTPTAAVETAGGRRGLAGAEDAGAAVVLPVVGRGSVPFAVLHKEPLFVHAARAAAACGVARGPVVVVVEDGDVDRAEAALAAAKVAAEVCADRDWAPGAGPVLVHDPLCPLTPPEFLRSVVAEAAGAGPPRPAMAFRPVTDTVKIADDVRIRGTVDRDTLAALSSPALLTRDLLERARAAGSGRPPLHDVTALLAWMRRHGEVELVRAPSMARRVDDESAVLVLQCVDELGRRTRTEVGRRD
jgi:2-C-methyl-D-erythritol 4-phosphate cytidylyltransferase